MCSFLSQRAGPRIDGVPCSALRGDEHAYERCPMRVGLQKLWGLMPFDSLQLWM